MNSKFIRLNIFLIIFYGLNILNAKTFIVDRYNDDLNDGSLRWAINESNKNNKEENKILLQAIGKAPYVIKINKPLPKIESKVQIIGTLWEKTGEYIAIDGSNYIKGDGEKACPGAVEGQYGTNVRTMSYPGIVLQDIDGIIIKGITIQKFCIGILINRSSNNLIQNNLIKDNYGGAGIMLTGDDGKGNATYTTTNNNKVINNIFLNNGDGLELTRGAAFNLVANNIFKSTKTNPEPSQGIEILWGNDNIVIANKFENYSDGLQINWGKRNYIAFNEFTNNSIGLNLTGNGNIIDRNKIHKNRIAIAIRSEKDSNTHITLTKNEIWNNKKNIKRCYAGGSCVENQKLGSIVFSVPGLEHDIFIGSRGGGVIIEPKNMQRTCKNSNDTNCNAIPNQGIKPPKLSIKDESILVEIKGIPNKKYTIEFFGNNKSNESEAKKYLSSLIITTNNEGLGSVIWKNKNKSYSITATMTDYLGSTSELSNFLVIKN